MERPSVFACRAARCVLLMLPVLLSGTGCYMNGMGCQPGDDTETCCLKEHPGAWERCTGMAGPPKTQPKNQPKPKTQPDPKGNPEPVSPPIPTPEEQREWNKRCQEFYVRCREFVEGDAEWRVYGESQCRSCFILCQRSGEWPAEANEKPCPGG